MIPNKKSKAWIFIFLIYSIIIFAALFITRIILAKVIVVADLSGLFLLSLCSGLIPCIAGYFGRRIFFFIYSIAVLLGIVYAFYVVIGDIAPGWGDLTSIIGYLFIVVFGLVIALLAETASLIMKANSKSNKT